jgi:hypothetical protein
MVELNVFAATIANRKMACSRKSSGCRPPHLNENPILAVHPYLACLPQPEEGFRYQFLGHA